MGTLGRLECGPIGGHCAERFAAVRQAFADNFATRCEVGAACSVYFDGEPVVDLHGGLSDSGSASPWTEQTLSMVFSATKGVTALAAARLASLGQLDHDSAVARYWPEFACAGKSDITVRQLLGHSAGLAWLDQPLTLQTLSDREQVRGILQRQRPAWRPGSRVGYHIFTGGLYTALLVQQVAGTTLERFFHDELSRRLGIEFHFVADPAIRKRTARVHFPSAATAISTLRTGRTEQTFDLPFYRAVFRPWSSTRRALGTAPDLSGTRLERVNTDRVNGLFFPSMLGFTNARSLARAYGMAALGSAAGNEAVVDDSLIASLCDRPHRGLDAVLRGPSSYSLGFACSAPVSLLGRGKRCFGFGGAGGTLAFADPDARIGFAYTPNLMGLRLADPRSLALVDAVYDSLDRARARGELS